MSILLDQDTRVIVQGITSVYGSRQTAAMLRHRTRVRAGVTPGKGGTTVHGVPVFDTVAEALADGPVDASAIYVAADRVRDAVVEAAEHRIKLAFVAAEGLPVREMMYLRALARERDMWLLGPNSLGMISPGKALMGAFPPEWAHAGAVGVISRGGTLLLHTARFLHQAGIGVSSAVHVGGDAVLGRNPVEYLARFEADPQTRVVVLLSEVGGGKDHECAAYLPRMTKPVVALVVGRSVPEGRAMGHAGALVGAAQHTAAAKIAVLRESGAHIADRPEDIPAIVRGLL